MTFISKPVFLTHEEVEKYKKDDKHGLALCQCPIPIYLPDGVNAHVVEYDKIYICKDCYTLVLLSKKFDKGLF